MKAITQKGCGFFYYTKMELQQRLKTAGSQLIKGNFGNVMKSMLSPQGFVVDSFASDTYRGNDSSKQWFFGANGVDYHFTFSNNQSPIEAYTKCSPLTSVINKSAQAYINGKTFIVDDNGKEATSKEALKIKKLLAKPNKLQSQSQFEAQTYIYSKLFGFSLILIVKPFGWGNMDADALWNIPPSMVDIKETEELFYKSEGTGIKSIVLIYNYIRTTLNVEDVFIIKDFSVSFSSVLFPESRIKPLSMEINNIIGAYESRNVLINNRGPLGILSNAGKDAAGSLPFKQDDKDDLHKQFLRYGLKDKQLRVIMTAATLNWQSMGVPTKDLMLFEEIEDDIMRVCDMYGYPYMLMSSAKGATFSNMNDAKKLLYQDTIIPDATSITEQMNSLFGLEELNITITKDYSHVPALQEDDVKKSTSRLILNQAKKIEYEVGLITINNWLQALGEDTIGPLGDVRATDVKNSNVPLATIIGVGGVQSLVGVLQASGISEEARASTLQILFGLSEQDATAMTIGNAISSQNQPANNG